MLNTLRSAAGTWVAKLLLILLVLSFAVWGISGQIFGGLGNNVLQAGQTRVSILEYRLAYDRQIALLSQQFGTQITREQAVAFGIDQQVLAQLVAGAVLDEQAREMDLGLSRDRLAQLTAEDPAFQGQDGNFDRNLFDFRLQQIGMRPEDYLRNREQVATRQQIVEAVSDGMEAPDAFLRALALYQGEDRTVEYVVLRPELVEPVEEPDDATLAAWFEENKARYAAPEYRRISYVKLEPSDIADPAAITPEQAREYYEANLERFTTPEQRRIEQLVFADEAAAEAALERIRGGATFEEIVESEGKTMDDVVLGTFPRDRVADDAVAEAAFALDEGAVSDVVAGSFGPILLRVTEIVPEAVEPFEEVSEDIREEIALDEANEVLLDVYDAYEDARASGETMAEAAQRQRLEVVTVEAVDAEGLDLQGEEVAGLPEAQTLLADAFETEVGVENPPLNVGANGYVFYEVDGVTPARDRELDEVRERVAEDWIAEETRTRLAARADELRQRIADGEPIATIAEEIGVEVQTRRGLTRGADDVDLGSAGVEAVFAVADGGSGSVAGENGGQIVFHVTEVAMPMDAGADAVPQETRDRFATAYSDDLLDQLVARLQGVYEVTVDRAAIEQALSF